MGAEQPRAAQSPQRMKQGAETATGRPEEVLPMGDGVAGFCCPKTDAWIPEREMSAISTSENIFFKAKTSGVGIQLPAE